jgi:dynein heavy chain
VQEKTELEEQRQVLAKEVQSYRSKISQLEEDLLFRLSNSKVHRMSCPIVPPLS